MSDLDSPNKGWCLVKVVLGIPMAAIFFGGLLSDGWEGPIPSAIIGAFIGLGVRMTATGVAGLGGKRIPARLAWILMLGVLGLCAAAGPAISTAQRQSAESAMWERTKDSTELADWNLYTAKVPSKFRRAEYAPRELKARAVNAYGQHNAELLRKIRSQANEKKATDPLYGEAAAEATKGLETMVHEALDKLSNPKADKKLQTAFTGLVDDIAHHEDGTVYLVFSTKSILKEPPSAAAGLERMRESPDIKKQFPKGDCPLIEPGKAFSPENDNKRQAVFVKAMSEAFSKVFGNDLLTIKPLEGDIKQNVKGKLVFLVRNLVVRTSDYYVRSRSSEKNPTQRDVLGIMFGIEVLWEFRIYDREGKQIYLSRFRSEPANDVRFRVGPSDPAWAPYSIMVDSAYYNYARKILQGFGLEPPPEKQMFEFEG